MQTGSSGTIIGWKSGQTTFVPLWDRMEGAWLRTLAIFKFKRLRDLLQVENNVRATPVEFQKYLTVIQRQKVVFP